MVELHHVPVSPPRPGMPLIVCDNADCSGAITIRLLALMKKEITVLGDEPVAVCIDQAQFLDLEPEDVYHKNIEDLGLEVSWIGRKRYTEGQRPEGPYDSGRNRTCYMVGRNGSLVIGIY